MKVFKNISMHSIVG